jgi:L-alanine-DL-glutamate epimerase-like enolase superfamily enzyme
MPLMTDANQGWSFDDAAAMLPDLAGFDLGWLEEPLRADAPAGQWLELAARASMPLAAGENVRGEPDFAALANGGAIDVIQPDLGKWGGFSACLPVAKQALAAGRRFCPHWLGGGVGLVASAHLLAAAGGDGMVEVDCNPNPLRDAVLPAPRIEAGRMRLQDAPGLGVVPNMELLESFRIA